MKKIFIAMVLTAVVSGCVSIRAKPVLDIVDMPVSIAGGEQGVAQQIKTKLNARGWKVIDEQANQIRAQFSKPNKSIGVHSVTIDVSYDADSVSIKYADSENMMYDESAHEIHRNYNRWIANLQTDLMAAN